MINSKDIQVRNCLTDSDHIRQEKELATLEAMENFKRKKFGRNLSLCSVSEDAGFELRTVATLALAVRHWHWH
jgi:hypothetical protein